MLPKLSIPKIIVIRGAIASLATELEVPGAYHFLLRKSLMPNQVSSIQRNYLLFLAKERNSKAHLWRRTRFFSELLWIAVSLIFRYFMPWSRFMTVQTSFSVIVKWGEPEGKAWFKAVSAKDLTYWALSMMIACLFRSLTTLDIASSRDFFACYRLWSSAKIAGFFFTLKINEETTAWLTRKALATSLWLSKETKTLCKISSFSSRRRGPRFFDLLLFPEATSSSKSGRERSYSWETAL